MPWRDHFEPHELEIITAPHTPIHIFSREQLSHLFELVLKQALIRRYPHLSHDIRYGWHHLTQPGAPLHALHRQAHASIQQAIASVDHRTGNHLLQASRWLDHHANRLLELLRHH